MKSDRFAAILTTAVIRIKALTGLPLSVIQDELGYALDRKAGGSIIQHYRKGNLPTKINDAWLLARELINRKGLMTLGECEEFLESAGYPSPKEAARKLWAEIKGEPVQVKAFREKHDFIVGPPIEQPRQFFGRERELRRIFGWWRATPLMHVSLVGVRRSGKTSLLHYLRTITTTPASELRRGQRTDWLPEPHRYRWIWVDFQDPSMRVRERLLPHLLRGCEIEVPEPCTLENFADAMDSHAWKSPCIVLMDELSEGLNSPELDQEFWYCLRSLLNSPTPVQLGFLVSSQEPPQQLAHERGKSSPFFNMFQTLKLGPFTEAEARELIASSPMPFPEPDVTWILSQSGRWPCLLQILCQERLMALQQTDSSENWQEAGRSRIRIPPYGHLLESDHE